MTFCEKAMGRLHALDGQSPKKSVLISIANGGCNGLSYRVEPMLGTPDKGDVVMEKDGTNIVVCGQSLLYLINTRVSWLDDHMGSRFDFDNPNAKSRCGCGTTFSVIK